MPNRGLLLLWLVVAGCEPLTPALVPLGLSSSQLIIAAAAQPAEVALPVLTPCAMGWRQLPATVDGGAATCSPWPGVGPSTCDADAAHFVGEAGCARLGTACPAGDFPEGLPAGAVRYVKAQAAAGGDGTQARPFASLAAALAGATSGTVLALAKGTFDEPVRVPAGVTLWGACVAQTVVTASTANATIGTVVPLGPEAALRNLTVRGNRPGVVVGVGGASLTMTDVAILETVGFGVVVANGAQATATGLLVRGVRPAASGGNGLYIEGGGRLTANRAAVEDVTGLGVVALGEGSAVLGTQLSVLRTLPRADGSYGNALEATLKGRITLSTFALEQSRDAAAFAQTGGVVSLTDGVVRETLPRARDNGVGGGFVALGGGRVEATRVTFSANHSTTAYVADAASSARLTDCVIDDTRAEVASGGAGFGLVVTRGAQAQVARLSVQRSLATGVSIDGAGTAVQAVDLTVLDTRGLEVGAAGGYGLALFRGATATLTRARLERSRSGGLAVGDLGSRLQVEDLTVRDTLADRSTGDSTGLHVQDGATVTLRRGLVERSEQLGLAVIAATLEVEDLVVRDTRGQQGNGIAGRGAQLQAGAQLRLRRGRFEDNREAGLVALGRGTVVTLEDVVVRGTRKRDCVPAGCPDEGGSGLAALGEGQVAATRVAVSGNAACGVEVGDLGTMDLSDGVVAGNPIGACVSTVGFDPGRIDQRVAYTGNQTKFSGDYVPLPNFVAPGTSAPAGSR